MWGLWRMWRYAPYLPAGDRLIRPPWEVADYEDDISGWDSQRQSISENRTRPIHPETMSALLVWSMRFVNDFSSDILRARQRRTDMDANIRRGRRDGDRERWNRYLDGLRRAGEPLPGRILDNGDTGLAVNYLAATLDVGLTIIQGHHPSDIAIRVGAPLDVEIRGKIEGEQWGGSDRFLRGRRLGAAPRHRLRCGDRLPLGPAPRRMPRSKARLLPAVRFD